MVKMNVKFETPEQLVEFSRMCQKVEADTLIEDTLYINLSLMENQLWE